MLKKIWYSTVGLECFAKWLLSNYGYVCSEIPQERDATDLAANICVEISSGTISTGVTQPRSHTVVIIIVPLRPNRKLLVTRDDQRGPERT
jgi:hypothetical protein